MRTCFLPATLVALLCFGLMVPTTAHAQASQAASANAEVPAEQLIQPADLASLLQSSKSPKPLLLQIGFRVLYVQAHIPGSEYVAAGSSPQGTQQLRERVQKLPRTKAIILY